MTYRTTMPSSHSVHPGPGRTRGVVITVLSVLLLGAGAGAWYFFGGGADDSEPVALGGAGRDGDFEFVVSGVKCGTPTVGSGAAAIRAQGVYCIVGIQVANRGAAPRRFDGSAQKVLDSSGTEYTSDTGAERQANPVTWYEAVVPGEAVKGQLVFDVPAGTKPTEIEMHETLLSAGVQMRLA
ncbi:hypothetical protein Adu01nite_79950 [Paractinoplanes durhamensis]|uniref:DUF4352 domain-containing protein n=2 Tax=Paractinoplanes durhamensis TaxID=113563 RepID=A0ABQ3ZA01_9ACTN|nr:hypothetical protein Adu01nite_79950 [Actinoplanes durhamensis]